ncbi:unnamed protein product [Chrysoparadoxa australica]
MSDNRTVRIAAFGAVAAVAIAVVIIGSRSRSHRRANASEGAKTSEDTAETVGEKEKEHSQEKPAIANSSNGKQESAPTPAAASPSTTDAEAAFYSALGAARASDKGGDYLEAAKHYTAALDMCDTIKGYEEHKATLYNNRSAMLERCQKLEESLMDCSLCLALKPSHKKCRIRRARIYDGMGRSEEALAELSALMLHEREVYDVKVAQGQQVEPQAPPPLLEEIIRKVADKDVAEILLSKENEPPRLPGKYQTFEVLRSFASYKELEECVNGLDEEAVNVQVEAADTAAAKVTALQKRAMLSITKQDFERVIEDLTAAYDLLEAAAAEGLSAEDQAALSAWYGTFQHLQGKLDEAAAMYEKSCELNANVADVWVKRAGVAMDREDFAAAEELFEKAMNVDVTCPTTYMYRAQVHAAKQDMDAAKADLATCLDLNPEYASAYCRLVNIMLASGDIMGAQQTLARAVKAVPWSSDALNANGELLFGMGAQVGNMQQAKEGMDYFELAYKAEPTNPAPMVNLGLANIQVLGDVDKFTRLMKEAIAADPTCAAAYVQLGQYAVSVASSEAEAEEGIAYFNQAIANTREKEALMELCSIRAGARARISGARALGVPIKPLSPG